MVVVVGSGRVACWSGVGEVVEGTESGMDAGAGTGAGAGAG